MTLCRTTICLAAAAIFAVRANAAEPFRVTTSDLATRGVDVTSFDAAKLVGRDAKTNEAVELPLAQIVALARAASKPTAAAGFAVTTRDGQRWIGTPTAIRNDAIVLQAGGLGEREVPLANVETIAAATAAAGDAGGLAGSAQDELRLANGDRLHGIVSGGDATNVTCQTPEGQSVAVAWANISRIRFAETQTPAATPANFRVTLSNGSRLRAERLTIANAAAELTISGKPVAVPLADVVGVEQLAGGDLRMLAWTSPDAVASERYFPQSTAGTRAKPFEVDADGAAAFGATAAIRVRPRSTLTWSVAEAAGGRFRARVVVPAGRSYADVTARVLAGDRVLFEKKNLRSGDAPAVIDVPLDGVERISLQVDFGDGFDVQDEVLWLDPSIVAATPAK